MCTFAWLCVLTARSLATKWQIGVHGVPLWQSFFVMPCLHPCNACGCVHTCACHTVVRLAGYENSLLGYAPKTEARAGRVVRDIDGGPLDATFDVVNFGHLMFELAMGYVQQCCNGKKDRTCLDAAPQS